MADIMRTSFVLLAAVLGLGLAGCDSVDSLPGRVMERFEAPPPKVRVYAGEQRAVFEAAVGATKNIGFIVSRSGAAQGLIKAHSPLHPGNGFGVAKQYSFEIHVDSYEPGKTEVSVLLHVQEESESFAGATDIPVREHGLYESYFAALDGLLAQRGEPVGTPQP
jgi:hypothetical protein